MLHRPARDADLLGFGYSDLDSIAQTFQNIAIVDVDTVVIVPERAIGGYALTHILAD